tara:strand:- start:48777 stop:49439 length:663 start_codon:yes stop_codon:yes gene_type:complete
MPELTVKRIFDIISSGIGLIVLSPVICFLCLLIRCTLGSPVFFVQPRIGWQSQSFYLVKFRTMRQEGGAGLMSDTERLTLLGRFLRRSSLDEIPELWNVLRGEMSLVGPRPLLVEYLPYYTAQQARRHEVRPGLTGWAQVNGRNSTSWQERFRLDNEYVDRHSFLFDIYILLLTILRVFDGRGVQNSKEVSMPRFDDEVMAGRTEGRISFKPEDQVAEGG